MECRSLYFHEALKAELAEGGVPHINLELPHDGGDVAEEAGPRTQGLLIRPILDLTRMTMARRHGFAMAKDLWRGKL